MIKAKIKKKVFIKHISNQKGFTLLETLISLMILSIMIVPIYFHLGQGLKGQQLQDEVMKLNMLTKRHLELIRAEYQQNNRLLSQEFLTEAEPNGYDQENRYIWELEITSLIDYQQISLYQVIITYSKLHEAEIIASASIATKLMGERIP
ncbi:MAG: type II secretion system protein [Bacillota bacterium]|nr:type II secretion system protein [Bacillota bacterium]